MRTQWVETASRIMPGTTARIAAGAMLLPGRRMPVRAEQRPVLARSRAETLSAGRHRIRVYRWGSGERRVLLVHGWSGRAAQFARLVSRLEPEASVVAFDAPAHGASPGFTADIGMWIEAISALDAAAGGFDTVVGHSFGGLAVRRAALAGLVHGSIVSIASPPSSDAVMRAYATQAGLPDAVASGTSAALARRLGPTLTSIAMGERPRRAGLSAAPLLVVHDDGDAVVPPIAADAVVAGWPGATTLLRTSGRGHNGILAAPEVIDAIAGFGAEATPLTAAAAG